MLPRKTILSPCRNYRYCLWREWDKENPAYAVFIGVNPSTADETVNDRTINRCVSFARSWGLGAMCMVNLFAYRTPYPEEMRKQADPIGPDNDLWLKRIAEDKHASYIVAGWGNNGTFNNRDVYVRQLLTGRLSYLVLNDNKTPKHPLYVAGDTKPQPFPPEIQPKNSRRPKEGYCCFLDYK